nr:hypothetical protein [Kibdelosporangium sp. MJ126-NF4]CTQ96559.1 hypothetical protein [Kibdelosporangium sp. MJ126-NF4]
MAGMVETGGRQAALLLSLVQGYFFLDSIAVVVTCRGR